ncbi:type I-E CRISPR-associated protein Cse2/CasB [Actinokineospora sp. G85]|uniref:type I-E CRISPR-associated protein Cse2/CasB n=1 Tax=Actinokineospora sp. G85 TaxID=3406626 RepID=UPI003C782090
MSTGTQKRSTKSVVDSFVGSTVSALQRQYLANASAGVAALARLRRAAGKDPGEIADVFEFTLSPDLAAECDPLDEDAPTAAEVAAHHAITLFALHQQSQTRPMHLRGVGFGSALRKVAAPKEGDTPKTGLDTPVVRRFEMLSTADSLPELAHHLRGAVQLLRSRQVPLDYGQFAVDLLDWQLGGKSRTWLRLRWGRGFHFAPSSDTEPEKGAGSDKTTG